LAFNHDATHERRYRKIMLKRLHLTNFKSWGEADLTCGRITGVFGNNSSGKTSLIQFLLLMKQTKDATDRAISLELNGDLVHLGTIMDVIHNHDEKRQIKWSLDFLLANELALSDPSQKKTSLVAKGDVLTLDSEISIQNKAPVARRLSYGLGNMSFSLAPRKDDVAKFQLKAFPEGGFDFVRTKGRAWELPSPIKSYAFPDQARTYYQNAGFLADLEAAYEAEIDKIFYLGPLREAPRRDYLWARSRPTDVGQRGEKAVDAILAATAAKEKRNLEPKKRLMPFEKIVAHWLQKMGLIESFSVVEIAPGSNRWQARVKSRSGASEVLLTDVGFGVSQVLPVITLLWYVPEGSTVILEQPEIHLHPLAQAGLADVILQAAKRRRVQVILESHSEHLLLRLQRRIAEDEFSADDVKLYFCNAARGSSTLEPLEIDLYGNISNWPDKFMGDAFNEAASAELARFKRMKAAE
jgi:predicted ATPase